MILTLRRQPGGRRIIIFEGRNTAAYTVTIVQILVQAYAAPIKQLGTNGGNGCGGEARFRIA